MNPLVDDPEAPENGLVELALHDCGCGGVKSVAVVAEAQQPVEDSADRLPFPLAGMEHGACLAKVAVYPPLLFLEKFFADGAVVVGA
ncbi:hypothetical protein [Frankia sp. AgB32]|uniref:hypothetical protein n=1 Tax=Frankia sp. AgB32 TaxID=631119 RepID=UPI00200F2B20|nr:hypothetical protein [Frankia sp. AgB32]MCK9895330.1 hypothetical protein [Frankia sp. AgB32]